MGVVKAPLCNSGLSVSHLREGYCWPTSFKGLGVLFLGEVSPAFLPSKKVCLTHKFRHLGVGQQYPEGFETRRKVILSFGAPCHVHMGDSVPDCIPYSPCSDTCQ